MKDDPGSERAIVPGKETIRMLRRAATWRFKDAEILRLGGRSHGAVYLYGYCVEMIVKSACYALDDRDPFSPITEAVRDDVARRNAAELGVDKPRNHQLVKWSRLLAEMVLKHRTDRELSREIVVQAQVVENRWTADMRYRPSRLSPGEVEAVGAAALWFRRVLSRYPNKIGGD